MSTKIVGLILLFRVCHKKAPPIMEAGPGKYRTAGGKSGRRIGNYRTGGESVNRVWAGKSPAG